MGTIKLILVLGLLGGLAYVCAEIIPPYFANYEFQDTLDTEARLVPTAPRETKSFAMRFSSALRNWNYLSHATRSKSSAQAAREPAAC